MLKATVLKAFGQMEMQLDCRVPRSFIFIIILFLSIRGRINFLQLERFSGRCESGFRYFFERSFDFLSFNKALLKVHLNGKTALAFDPGIYRKPERKRRVLDIFGRVLPEKASGDLSR